MTYEEIKKVIENKELSVRAERDFSKLNENSKQLELDRFVRLNRSLFASEKSAQQKAFEEYYTLQKQIKGIYDLYSEDFDGDFFALANQIVTGETIEMPESVKTKLSEYRSRQIEILEDARTWAKFVGLNPYSLC